MSIVSFAQTECYEYPDYSENFRPSKKYPEYWCKEIAEKNNEVYDMVREALHLMKLDEKNYGTSHWNPLKTIVKPGNNVLLKPNLVMHCNPRSNNNTDCLYTQPAVVAAVIDYVILALMENGKINGTIIVGDAPMQECNFAELVRKSGYDKLIDFYKDKGIDIKFVDFRGLKSVVQHGVYHQSLNDESKGILVKLDEASEFSTIDSDKLKNIRITNYDPDELIKHHNNETHEYLISEYILNADVIINMPKPKCHRKAGVTIALKNFVGANVRKEYLPHHTIGSKEEGGDEYLKKNFIHSLRSLFWDKKNKYTANHNYFFALYYRYVIKLCTIILKCFHKNEYAEGSWYGNETIAKTICDLNKIVFYADQSGKIHNTPVRKMFIVADMIVSGENDGPVAPDPKNVGAIACGDNPVCFDEMITTLMGFDIKKIPTFKYARNVSDCHKIVQDGDTPILLSNNTSYNNKSIDEIARNKSILLNYIANPGWIGHIEL